MLRPRILCADCNELLGKEVEERAEAAGLGMMLRPSDGTTLYRLTQKDQRALATWAAKVALLEPYMRIRPTSADPQHLADFREHLRPPPTFAVWFGAYSGKGPYSRFVHRTTEITVTAPHQPPQKYPGEILTFYIGHALFQVFKGQTARPHTVRSPDPFGGALVRIWPPRSGEFLWPTWPWVTPETFAFFALVGVPLP